MCSLSTLTFESQELYNIDFPGLFSGHTTNNLRLRGLVQLTFVRSLESLIVGESGYPTAFYSLKRINRFIYFLTIKENQESY